MLHVSLSALAGLASLAVIVVRWRRATDTSPEVKATIAALRSSHPRSASVSGLAAARIRLAALREGLEADLAVLAAAVPVTFIAALVVPTIRWWDVTVVIGLFVAFAVATIDVRARVERIDALSQARRPSYAID